MRIRIVTPAPRGSRAGNRVTALRWARIFRSLGHEVEIVKSSDTSSRDDIDPEVDLLVALHAIRSAAAVERFASARPGSPVVVALTGTDVYGGDLTTGPGARSIALATRLVVLQPLAIRRLPPEARSRARVVLQSASRSDSQWPGPRTADAPFEVIVIGGLRPVKDPFRAALAARELKPESRVRIVHVGGTDDAEMRARAEEETATNPRYVWLGARPRRETLLLLAASRLAVVSSFSEGGANVISEAVAAGVPILASKIDGNVGLLGPEYPGYFTAGDTASLARQLERAETDPGYLAALAAGVARVAPAFTLERETRSWAAILGEIGSRSAGAAT